MDHGADLSLRDLEKDAQEYESDLMQMDEDDVTIFRERNEADESASINNGAATSTSNSNSHTDRKRTAKSPAKGGRRAKKASLPGPGTPSALPELRSQPLLVDPPPTTEKGEEKEAESESKDNRLMAERDRLRQMNGYLENTIQSLQVGLNNAKNLSDTVDTTYGLMDLYVKLLSQMTHTSDLIRDPNWEPSKDNDELEARAARELAEQQKKAEAERQQTEEQERQRQASKTDKKRQEPTRGRGAIPRVNGRGVRSTRGRGTTARGGSSSSGTSSRLTNTTSSTSQEASSSSRGAASTSRSIRASGTVTGVRGQRGLRSRVATRPPRAS